MTLPRTHPLLPHRSNLPLLPLCTPRRTRHTTHTIILLSFRRHRPIPFIVPGYAFICQRIETEDDVAVVGAGLWDGLLALSAGSDKRGGKMDRGWVCEVGSWQRVERERRGVMYFVTCSSNPHNQLLTPLQHPHSFIPLLSVFPLPPSSTPTTHTIVLPPCLQSPLHRTETLVPLPLPAIFIVASTNVPLCARTAVRGSRWRCCI
jgi:hypothetical protein